MAGTNVMSGDILQFRVITKDETGGECFNIYNFGINSVTGAIGDLDCAEIFDTALAPLYKAIMSPTTNYDGTEVSIINRTPKPITQKWTLNSGPGTIGTKTLPTQVAGIISWGTAFAGRAFRGRSYIPNLADGWKSTGGIPTTFFQTAMAALASSILGRTSFTDIGTANATFILFHRRTLGFNLMLSYDIPLKFATQRRRGNYGKNRIPPI